MIIDYFTYLGLALGYLFLGFRASKKTAWKSFWHT